MVVNEEARVLWERALQAIQSARALLSSDFDGAASRAYYSAFYAVSAVFALRGKSFTKHSAVQSAVHRDLVNTGLWSPDLGEAFSFLFELRSTADYGKAKRVSVEEAEKTVSAAHLILKAAHEINPEDLPYSG
ncbi:MAG TPA: HEPN domain-containing protein [bacterium]|nr:HEPN domain-containing protein [bacterium]